MKKKLPAFGGALVERRRRGDHPLCVHLIYGYKWREPHACFWGERSIPGEHPLLALKPLDYQRGLYDWRIVTGVYVAVFDQGHEPFDDLDHGPPRPWWCYPLYSLLGELAQHAAEVEVYRNDDRFAVGDLASSARFNARTHGHRNSPELNHGWPHWWSASIAENNAERVITWFGAIAERKPVSA